MLDKKNGKNAIKFLLELNVQRIHAHILTFISFNSTLQNFFRDIDTNQFVNGFSLFKDELMIFTSSTTHIKDSCNIFGKDRDKKRFNNASSKSAFFVDGFIFFYFLNHWYIYSSNAINKHIIYFYIV